MTSLSVTFLIFVITFNLIIFILAFNACSKRKNAYGETPFFYPLGMYVWGDALVFSFFWATAASISLYLHDWILFWLIFSVFWLVRSIGETVYWLNQQFSPIIRYDIERLPARRIFHNDSVWFIFQIMNQCLTVVTIITTLYLAKIWLSSF